MAFDVIFMVMLTQTFIAMPSQLWLARSKIDSFGVENGP